MPKKLTMLKTERKKNKRRKKKKMKKPGNHHADPTPCGWMKDGKENEKERKMLLAPAITGKILPEPIRQEEKEKTRKDSTRTNQPARKKTAQIDSTRTNYVTV